MSAIQAVSVELPEELYERIRYVAWRTGRSVEAVLLESLTVLFNVPPMQEEMPPAALDQFSDEQLWAVVYQRLAWPDNERLRELAAQGRQTELSHDEQVELEQLVDRVDRYTVLRSRALWLLKQRGYDVQHYLKLGA